MADLRVYLLRDTVGDPAKALRLRLDSSGLSEVKVKPGAMEGPVRLFWGRNQKERPGWVKFVQDIAADELDIGASETRSAILFVKSNERWFAFTFGQAWGALDDADIEDQFGIRVALNLLDPEKVKTIDTKTWSAYPLHTTRQLTRAGPLDEFRISYLEDFVNLVEAVPVDRDIGDLVTGKQALVLKRQAQPDELPELCDTLWKAFKDNRYKEIMPFLDRLRTVHDRTHLRLLDDQLVQTLKTAPASVHIGTPELHSLDGCSGFRFAGNRAKTSLRPIEPEASDYLLLHPGGHLSI